MSKILVCAATSTEANACESGIRKAGASSRFEMLKTGIGPASAAESLKRRLTKGAKPSVIVSSGFAGSWSESLDVGTWISSQTVLNELGDPLGNLKIIPETTESILFSVSEILKHPPQDLIAVVSTFNLPITVDMESFALAQVAQKADIGFSVLRFISDSPRHPLPKYVRQFTGVAIHESPAEKVSALFQGVRSLVQDSPADIVQFLRNGYQWRAQLVQGWSRFACVIQ